LILESLILHCCSRGGGEDVVEEEGEGVGAAAVEGFLTDRGSGRGKAEVGEVGEAGSSNGSRSLPSIKSTNF